MGPKRSERTFERWRQIIAGARNGQSQRTIANALGISQGAVGRHVIRIRQHLASREQIPGVELSEYPNILAVLRRPARPPQGGGFQPSEVVAHKSGRILEMALDKTGRILTKTQLDRPRRPTGREIGDDLGMSKQGVARHVQTMKKLASTPLPPDYPTEKVAHVRRGNRRILSALKTYKPGGNKGVKWRKR